MKKFTIGLAFALSTSTAIAGGPLSSVTPSNEIINGIPALELIDTKWDARCSRIQFVVDSSVDPLDINGNPIPIEQWLPEIEAAAQTWSDIPTSFIEIDIIDVAVLESADPTIDTERVDPLFGDHLNALTFNTAGFQNLVQGVIAIASPTVLLADTTYIANTDLDGDGDIDVFAPGPSEEQSCADIDGDGDIEFIAGDYKAGTIIESDIVFLASSWETAPAGPDPATFAIASDIQNIAFHEIGHAIGLDHSALSQVSEENVRNPAMFPFAPSDSAIGEFLGRTPWDDDEAWVSFLYPEGSDTTGPAALQAGDISFHSQYSILRGSVKQGRQDVIGAAVHARDISTGDDRFEGYSGRIGLFGLDPTTFVPTLFSRRSTVVDGDFEIPVDRNADYQILLEPLDGPVFPESLGAFGQVASALGQTSFPAESWRATPADRQFEIAPGRFDVVNGVTKQKIDFQLNNVTTLSNVLPGGTVSLPFDLFNEAEIVYAERFENKDVLKEISRGGVLTTARLETFPFGDSVSQRFAEVSLALGRVNEAGEVIIEKTLRRSKDFVVQRQDFTPFYLTRSRLLTSQVKDQLRKDKDLDLFVIATSPVADFTDPSTLSPIFLLDSNGNVDPTTSFVGTNGGPITSRQASNWSINLHFANSTRRPQRRDIK